MSVKAFRVHHSEFHLFQAFEKDTLYRESTIDPHTLVAQKVANEVVFRRLQG